ncbi:hypothetical protein BDN72DRAFT_808414 [Pluteus cervinus]|uniref:Uncharacterized protein n=1 Tax=Pluteus cervinus TaxID=181527 RepID=A0ACD3BHJ4_9AGAR|nr:hypothetical protein BDN72DRAFT_808414 [Pluteus cervinus]
MDASHTNSLGTSSSRSRSSTKLADDVTSLTSFNPFSEEDENDQSSYTLVTSLFSRVKNTLSAPLSTAVAVTSPNGLAAGLSATMTAGSSEQRRPSLQTALTQSSTASRTSGAERKHPLVPRVARVAPPLVSLTPAQSEIPVYNPELERSSSRNGMYFSPSSDGGDGGVMGTSIPGFAIQDDARSIRTMTSVHWPGSVSKVFRRLRGEGLTRDYWMDDENCKECYDCKSVFTTWRRKHHCRICGQIFCSRCASNVIKGSRFGHDGMLRVCNLCLDKLAKVDEDDDDDRHSVVSSVASFPAHQYPQSPFAAAKMFGRQEGPFPMFSIATTTYRPAHEMRGKLSPWPADDDDSSDESLKENAAPFRRRLSDEEKDTSRIGIMTLDSPVIPTNKPSVKFPPVSSSFKEQSTIQFPVGSPEQIPGSLGSSSRLNGADSFDETPFIRSRAQSRLDAVILADAGWRTRRESTAYAQELNLASMNHLKIMLRQMLTLEGISNVKEWEDSLLKLALRIARDLTFTNLPYHQGADMDVRRYVKIKKIPGGLPSHSEYVDGAVITKNVAHKHMSRSISNPRIMLVGFPLEFYRSETQYVHFGQVVRQEKEYLTNLASRIAALSPHVVLVEKSVSSLALDALSKHNIVVARAVKTSAVQTISRMTQGDIISSIDKLAIEPHLGHCSKFRIQTFDHPLIPGRRKTYMRFEGCNRDMGCTIILRGGNMDTLRRIKKVTRFLTFIVRNLKLETHLWKDSIITLPVFSADAVPSSMMPLFKPTPAMDESSALLQQASPLLEDGPSLQSLDLDAATPHLTSKVELEEDDSVAVQQAERQFSQRIDDSLRPYARTFISVSAALRFPPPYPLRRMKELDLELIEARREWEEEVTRRQKTFIPSHEQEATITQSTVNLIPEFSNDAQALNAEIEALPPLNLPLTPLMPEKPLNDYGSESVISDGSVYSTSGASSLSGSLADQALALRESDFAAEGRYIVVKSQHDEQRRVWEWYLRKNKDDFIVDKYQNISYWEYSIPCTEKARERPRPCFPPTLNYVEFYGENDCTLGQYLEKAVNQSIKNIMDPMVCTGKICQHPLSGHGKLYVHNEVEVTVVVEQWSGEILTGFSEPDVTTWSACTLCGCATPFIPVSQEMQRYSFAKFLELHFYPADVKLVQGAGCHHNIFRHHIRYFAVDRMTVRFQASAMSPYEVVYPPTRVWLVPQDRLHMKNSEFKRLHRRNEQWYSGLRQDLRQIELEIQAADEVDPRAEKVDLTSLIIRAEREQEEISRFIDRIYLESAPTDILALNQVHEHLQDRIVAFQVEIDKLPRHRASISDGAKRVSAFDSVRAMWTIRPDLKYAFDLDSIRSPPVSDLEVDLQKVRRGPLVDPPTSSASSASVSEAEMDGVKAEKAPPSSVVSMSKEATNDEKDESVAQSDVESDSTIGAGRPDNQEDQPLDTQPSPEPEVEAEDQLPPPSMLPRRSTQPLVAELIRKYQDVLPAQGVEELMKTALPPLPPPLISESEQEYVNRPRREPIRPKNRQISSTRKSSGSKPGQTVIPTRPLTESRPMNNDLEAGPSRRTSSAFMKRLNSSTNDWTKPASSRQALVSESEQEYTSQTRKPPFRGKPRPQLSKKTSNSDFEHSYAANIAPRYLSNPRKSIANGTRIPGPKPFTFSSRVSSRHPSPEKRIPSGRRREVNFNGPSPPDHFDTKLGTSKPFPKGSYGLSLNAGRHGPRKASGGPVNKVQNMAKHFEKLGRDADRAKNRFVVIRGRRLRPVASPCAKVEVLDSLKDVVQEESEASDSSSEADDEGDGNERPRVISNPRGDSLDPTAAISRDTGILPPESGQPEGGPSNLPEDGTNAPDQPMQPSGSSSPVPSEKPLENPPSVGETPEKPSANTDQAQPQFLLDPPDPTTDTVHIFRDCPVVVRTDEPTSIIALALSSPQYRELLAKSRAESRAAREARLTEGGEAFMPDDKSVAESTSTWGVVNVDSSVDTNDPTEELRAPSSKLPWAISFESGGLIISCTILYPEHFDALRRRYGCETSMVESLSRCIKWDATGGKSGCAFLKTQDDRFIAKELSRVELQSMETFAPAYFDYLSSAVSANRPTLLAKVFGCFKVTFRKKGSGRSRSTQMTLLVMENLFYNARFSKIYDLKGSMRNRHNPSTGKANEVLLDENLVESAHENPLYLREHSKRILRGALHNDSKFLSEINVMDYSLVCGVDSENKKLVVGIVDYVRTYTWDKKLESWVKDSTFLGRTGAEPTIVTPKQYRQRFLSAMERYFPLVPDRWMKHKDTPDDDPQDHWPDW